MKENVCDVPLVQATVKYIFPNAESGQEETGRGEENSLAESSTEGGVMP